MAQEIRQVLQRLEINIRRKSFKRAMEFMNIKALYPKIKTSISSQYHKKYPYLLNEFKNDNNQVIINEPNKVCSSDITYIRLKNGYAYLYAIIDWHTKKILSHKLSITLTKDVLLKALSKYPKPDIFNTDHQGSQYTSCEFIDILKNNGILISMDDKERSIDNIVIERF